MIDLDSLRAIALRATGNGWQAAYRQDVTALVAEVERLREIADSYLLEMGRQHKKLREKRHADNEALAAAWDAGCDSERAVVVAWLRECDNVCREHDGRQNAVSASYRTAAAGIERGEHYRKGDE